MKTVQVHVSRLRRALGPDAVVTASGGYAIAEDAGEVDADRFSRLVAEGRRALEAGDPRGASCILREALSLTRSWSRSSAGWSSSNRGTSGCTRS